VREREREGRFRRGVGVEEGEKKKDRSGKITTEK